jgi:hypothetical protein
MNAIKFIKEHGVEKAREVVEGAPELAEYYSTIDGEYYRIEINAVNLKQLKRLVESIYLVKEHYTLDRAIEFAAKQEWGSFRADWYQNRTAKQPITTYQTSQQRTANEHDRWRQAEQQAFGERDVTPKKSLLIEEVGHA